MSGRSAIRRLDGSPPDPKSVSSFPVVQLAPQSQIVDFDDLPTIAHAIRSSKRVALQFPDELLHVAVDVTHELQRLTDVAAHQSCSGNDQVESTPVLFILADTSCGSCCVDEVAAEHYAAGKIPKLWWRNA